MVALDPAPLGEAAAVIASPTLAVGSLAALGLLGVTDWILGDDEPPEGAEEPSSGGSGMFEDPETAGDGGVAGAGGGDAGGADDAGDEFAFDDGGGDDAFGDFDVDGMDEEGGGGGSQVRDIERRVDEMEEELSGISSTVSTVRTENEQISESVDDIEENVRKLLDIYKMVTKGVNPFVDEDGGGGFDGDGASLGLFDQDGDDDDEEEQPGQLDEDVADADAEEFFDDDFEEDEAFDDEDDATADDPSDETDQAMAQSDDAPADEEGGAKSFDELREEYEDGAEWSEEDEGDADEADADADTADEDGDLDPDGSAVDEVSEAESEDDGVEDERVDALFEEDGAADEEPTGEAGAHQPAPRPAAPAASQTAPRTGARQPVGGGPAGEKPYLRELPSGYVSDLLVMEWIEFLVTESSPAGAHRAITYYENVGWIGHRAADQLREFVDGHPEASADADDTEDADGALTMDHHTTSLRYVARITGDVQENVLDSWDEGDNRWLHR